MKTKDLRAVCIVPYNLSPIQQGIQAAHAIVEYSLGESPEYYDYVEWAEKYKTVIILNGGTTGHNSSMGRYQKDLDKLGVTYSTFREPDLNNAITAICMILDYKEDTHIVGYLRQMRLA